MPISGCHQLYSRLCCFFCDILLYWGGHWVTWTVMDSRFLYTPLNPLCTIVHTISRWQWCLLNALSKFVYKIDPAVLIHTPAKEMYARWFRDRIDVTAKLKSYWLYLSYLICDGYDIVTSLKNKYHPYLFHLGLMMQINLTWCSLGSACICNLTVVFSYSMWRDFILDSTSQHFNLTFLQSHKYFLVHWQQRACLSPV